MKKIKILAFFMMTALCFSLLFFKASPNNAYATENSNTERIDVSELVSDKVITDSTKKYILTGTGDGRTITIINDSLLEQTFYITIENLFMVANNPAPVISIQGNLQKTTVNFNIQGSNELYGNLFGAIHLKKYEDPEIENINNAKIVVNFSTTQNGTIELTSVVENISSPTFYIQDNVDASINLCEYNTKLTSFTVNGRGFDTFNEGITEASKDASKTNSKIRLEKADSIQNKIEFNMMGHGLQVESVLLPETQTKYSPNKIPNADGLVFDGWYKDITLNHKWNPKTDMVTEDLTLYAGWLVPGENDDSSNGKLPIWAIVLISVSSFVILIGNAYVLIYFCAYKKNKLNNKFFNTIYKPFKIKETEIETKENKKEKSLTDNKKQTKDAENKSESKKTSKIKNQDNKNTSKKEILNKNAKNDDSKKQLKSKIKK